MIRWLKQLFCPHNDWHQCAPQSRRWFCVRCGLIEDTNHLPVGARRHTPTKRPDERLHPAGL